MNTNLRKQLLEKFENKEYRDAFVEEQIFSRLPLMIRALREARDLTQKQLGDKAEMAQAWVSKLEDPSYGKLTIPTLLKLASAYDVGLSVDFVPFSDVIDRAATLSRESFVVPSYAEDSGLVALDDDQVSSSEVCPAEVAKAPNFLFRTAVGPYTLEETACDAFTGVYGSRAFPTLFDSGMASPSAIIAPTAVTFFSSMAGEDSGSSARGLLQNAFRNQEENFAQSVASVIQQTRMADAA